MHGGGKSRGSFGSGAGRGFAVEHGGGLVARGGAASSCGQRLAGGLTWERPTLAREAEGEEETVGEARGRSCSRRRRGGGVVEGDLRGGLRGWAATWRERERERPVGGEDRRGEGRRRELASMDGGGCARREKKNGKRGQRLERTFSWGERQ
ncbi:hypothetical protein I3760_05G258700 [Carya illinoinensis]|nr:hypothetical protein I3760_05G258700 [Carya illinoinensis]